MTLHLVKLCVGIDSVEDLEAYRRDQVRQAAEAGVAPFYNRHRTRSWPRRADELLDGGSLYWVIKGQIRARQKLVRLEQVTDEEGRSFCGLVMEPEVVRTEPRGYRAFQGWRYLEETDAPADARQAGAIDPAMPPDLAEELRRLGLL